MRKLDSFKAKARALARSGHFYGLPPIEFELSFEEGFHEAGEWLELASTKEELERLCQESRANRKDAMRVTWGARRRLRLAATWSRPLPARGRSRPEFRSLQKILEGWTQCRQQKASNQFVGLIGRQKGVFRARAGRETPALKQATSFG
jgi:hypothetical protein